jgi:hypothetical protein
VDEDVRPVGEIVDADEAMVGQMEPQAVHQSDARQAKLPRRRFHEAEQVAVAAAPRRSGDEFLHQMMEPHSPSPLIDPIITQMHE